MDERPIMAGPCLTAIGATGPYATFGLDEADVRKPTLVSFPNTLLRNFDCVCM